MVVVQIKAFGASLAQVGGGSKAQVGGGTNHAYRADRLSGNKRIRNDLGLFPVTNVAISSTFTRSVIPRGFVPTAQGFNINAEAKLTFTD
jgi:hypothetical protein